MYTATQLLDKINEYISELQFTRKPKGLYDPVEYVLSLGGKRIRPVLMMMAHNLYKDENISDVLSSAVGVEIYHNYTLLHDDLMDKADVRRNKPTVHKVWDDNTAILSGDAMLVLAYQFISNCSPLHLKEVLDLFSLTALEICEGQQFDMEFEKREDVTEDEYIEMIRLKTAVLLAAGLKIGAILGGAPKEDAQALYEFGIYMGLAFQLQDDFLDVYGNPEIFGKNIGGDILSNKKTYLLIKALERADAFQKMELLTWLQKINFEPEAKIKAVTQLYNQIGVKAICESKMREYYAKGLDALIGVGVPVERKRGLKSFAELLLYREM